MQLNHWFEYNWKAEFHTHKNKHKYKSLSSIRKSDNKARLLAPSSLSLLHPQKYDLVKTMNNMNKSLFSRYFCVIIFCVINYSNQ